jgi:hypothetical protein
MRSRLSPREPRLMKNLLLDLVSLSDLKLLQPHLRPACFKQHHVLFEPMKKSAMSIFRPAGLCP